MLLFYSGEGLGYLVGSSFVLFGTVRRKIFKVRTNELCPLESVRRVIKYVIAQGGINTRSLHKAFLSSV